MELLHPFFRFTLIMALLHLEPLPRKTTKGDLLAFVCHAGLDRKYVGKIDLHGAAGVVEVPDGWDVRLVKALDGAEFKGRRVRAWTAGATSTTGEEDHFQRLARLLEMESQEEARQAEERAQRSTRGAEANGTCLLGLVVAEEQSGLGCRCILTLMKRNRSQPLPWHRLQSGAPVLLSEEGASGGGMRGVVCERGELFLRVAVNEPPDETAATFRVELSSDEAARLRQRAALERVRTARGERLAELRQVLLGDTEPKFEPETDFPLLAESLNESQVEAVRFALSAEDVAILHGPPGTGKTTTVVELIRQAIRRGDKVLACAPSNMAVDNLLERLVAHGERAVRLGHPARVQEELRAHTLDVLADDHDDVRQARKYTKDAFALFRKAGKWTRAKPEPGARGDMRREARALLDDARKLEQRAVERVLDSATVLCATLTGLDSEVLGQRTFDLAVIDEACQCTEPGCWIPLLRSKRVVLAGDHCQLPPTVLSPEAASRGFDVSLLERLVDQFGPAVTRRLRVQYRMHETIMAFSAAEFYEGDLAADPSVAGHLLYELPGVQACELTETPVTFIDTAGAGYDEEQEEEGESRRNPEEARLVVRKVRELLEAGVATTDIAVIAPYAAHVRLLREQLHEPGLEIDSVDGFQGREKEAVVVSLVRSNMENEIGFLSDVRRMNVALTRARRKLVVVGDSATLSVHPFYQNLFTYFETVGAYHTVWEEP